MKKPSFFIAFALFGLFAFGSKIVLAQPNGVPEWSHPNIFTYYTPGNVNMPAGSDLASKAVMLMDSYNDTLGTATGTSGAIFPIRTFRDDNNLCMCLTAHQIRNSSSTVPVAGTTVNMMTNLYSNYLGKDSLNAAGGAYNKTLSFDKTFLLTGELKEYIYDPATGSDIALLWIDKRLLSTSNYVELGADFDDNWLGGFYLLSYPLFFPLRVSDHLPLITGSSNAVTVGATEPYSTAPGSGGAPLMQSVVIALNGPVAKAVQYASDIENRKELYTLINGVATKKFYSTAFAATKMKLLESAIRQHCWNKQDSATISTDELYKHALEVDNTLFSSAFGTSQTFSSSTQLTGAATSSIFSVNTPENAKLTTVKADNCSFDNANGFTIPTVYPGTNNTWQVQVLAKTADIKPGFEYTASGNALLSLGTVVLSTTRSASRQLSGDTNNYNTGGTSPVTTKDPSGFKVYPNPSTTGVFSLDLPVHINNDKAQDYKLVVRSADGKLISQSEKAQPGLRCQIDLSGFSRGSYFLSVYQDDGKMVYSTVLIY